MITTNRLADMGGVVEDRHYGYDGLDRLSDETVLDATGGVMRSVSWNYDLAGNRLSQTADGSNTTYTYTQANRLTSWTGGSAAFDAAGCVTNLQYPDGRVLSLSWNTRYQLTAVATNGGQAESYGHDALGRRVWTASGGVTNWQVYDGAQVVADVDAAGGLLRSYVWGPGIDNLLLMTTYGETTSTYYAIKDHLGSVLALVDGTGAVVESYRYDAWGRVLEVRDAAGLLSVVGGQWSSPLGNRYLWQGREYSWATGLYNFRARWYDPIIGRWISNDPIGISGGLNQYRFCYDSPVVCIDPFGLSGTMTLVSWDDGTRYGGILAGGHAWIEYTPDAPGSSKQSYGTWPKDEAKNRKGGLNEGLELDKMHQNAPANELYKRTAHLTDDQEKAFMVYMKIVKNRGEEAWTRPNNCSSFASTAWGVATGEYLSPKGPKDDAMWATPHSLGLSIYEANGNEMTGTWVPKNKY
jgi:RHS repeat-associated protein